MLRGNYQARIDEKGRLKVPSTFRAFIEQTHGARVFVTSVDGASARVYPMPTWEAIEARLAAMPSTHPARRKFSDHVNYYGQVAEIDGQGRLLIHPRLREAAGITGEVDVIGALHFLDIWNHERFAARLAAPFTDDELNALSAAGV